MTSTTVKIFGEPSVATLQPDVIPHVPIVDIEHIPVQDDPRKWSPLRKVPRILTGIRPLAHVWQPVELCSFAYRFGLYDRGICDQHPES